MKLFNISIPFTGNQIEHEGRMRDKDDLIKDLIKQKDYFKDQALDLGKENAAMGLQMERTEAALEQVTATKDVFKKKVAEDIRYINKLEEKVRVLEENYRSDFDLFQSHEGMLKLTDREKDRMNNHQFFQENRQHRERQERE